MTRRKKLKVKKKKSTKIKKADIDLAALSALSSEEMLSDLFGDIEQKTQRFFESDNRPTFTKRERRGIYDWVMERVERILLTMNQSGKVVRESAWRIAVESWLRSRGYIKVHINQKCHPISPPFLAHE